MKPASVPTARPQPSSSVEARPEQSRLVRMGVGGRGVSSIARVLAPAFRGRGIVFMLHHITPTGAPSGQFAPNLGLEITPDFLGAVIDHVRGRGYDIIALDDVGHRLRQNTKSRPFAVFTIDDGYRDNVQHARPVFHDRECPFTVFVTTGLIDGTLEIWWRVLEAAVAHRDEIDVTLDGERLHLVAQTTDDKRAAYEQIYWPVRRMDEHEQRRWIRSFADVHDIDVAAMCRDAAMSWDDVRALHDDPLATVGAHSVQHFAMARLSDDEAAAEVVESRDRITAMTGHRPRCYAYPYGDEVAAGERDFRLVQELGFDIAVTTRKGVVRSRDANALTAVPRLSLNGLHQNLPTVDGLMSGVAAAAWNGLNAAKRIARRINR